MGVSFKVSKIGKRYVPKPIAGQPECSTSESSKENFLNKPESNKKSDIIEAPNSFAAHKLSALTEHDVSIILNLLPRGYFVEKPSEVENFQPLLQDLKSLHPYDRASKSLFSAIETGWLPGDLLDDIPCKYINGNVICEIRDYRKCTSEQGTAAPTDAVPVINRIRLRMSMENVVKDIPLIADDSWTYSDLMEVESRILKALQPNLDLCPVPRFDRICADTSIIKLDIDVGRKKRLRPTPEVTVTSNQTHGKKICIDGIPENANNSGESGAVLSSIAMQHAYGSATTQQLPSVISSSQPNNSLQEGARPSLPVTGHSKFQSTVNHPGILQDHGLSPANYVGVNAGISLPQNMMSLYTDTANANVTLHGRREAQDPHLTSMPGLKRPRLTAAGLDGIPTHQISPPLAGFNASDMQWKNQTVHPPIDAKGFQHSNGVPRFPQMKQEVGTSIYFNQQAMKYGPKEEQIDSDKLDKQDLERSKDSQQPMVATDNAFDQHQLSAQNQAQQSSMRGHLPPLTQWNNLRLSVDKDVRKDDMLQKRKTLPSPRVSSGPMVQSPVSSKSGEISSGSIGGQYNAMTATSALNSQLDKVMTNSSTVVGAPSVASSPSDSVHRQSQASASLKRKANSVPKIQAMSGIGSPASVSNFNTPLNANSPSIGTSSTVDQVLIDKFMKIEMISQRYQLNARKNKAENYPAKKLMSYSSQQVALSLSDSLNSEDFTDLVQPLSRSIRCGNINTCKTRVLTFISPERFHQVVPGRSPSRLILIEKPFDGTVAMQYGDTDDSDLLSSPDCWQTLPTTNHADLLAAQFCALMDRDGHHKAEDQVFQAPTPAVRIGVASGGPPVVTGISSEAAASEGRHANLAPSLLSNAGVPSNSSGMGPMSSQGLSNNARMQTAGSGTPTLPTSQGYFPGSGIPARNQHLEQPLLQQQHHQLQQQQQLQQLQSPQSQLQQHQQQLPLSQIQRSSPLITNNPLSHLIGQNSNIQMGSNPIVNNKSAHMQLQMLQQQQQQQQQHQQHQQQQHNQIPRKVMMGLGAAMGMGNMGNNMVGLAGLGNVIGMGGVRGLSSPMGALPGLGNVNPNQLLPTSASSFGTGIRPTSMSPAQAAAAAAMATKMRLAQQNRVGMYGTQPGIANMAGSSNQMLPTTAGLSMLNHALNRANISSMQPSAAMASMGPPKLSGPNFYLNQQQLQLQQHQQRLQQQQQQLQQQSPQMQQQQISSPLQQPQVGSPSVAGSPSAMVAQQQQPQISPQQMGQQTPMSPQQFNSGALQQINNGSMGVAPPPASPQLSSQTHGSVGSISSSPMEQLQGANKGGSSNA